MACDPLYNVMGPIETSKDRNPSKNISQIIKAMTDTNNFGNCNLNSAAKWNFTHSLKWDGITHYIP